VAPRLFLLEEDGVQQYPRACLAGTWSKTLCHLLLMASMHSADSNLSLERGKIPVAFIHLNPEGLFKHVRTMAYTELMMVEQTIAIGCNVDKT
jgi:hypothetical protein